MSNNDTTFPTPASPSPSPVLALLDPRDGHLLLDTFDLTALTRAQAIHHLDGGDLLTLLAQAQAQDTPDLHYGTLIEHLTQWRDRAQQRRLPPRRVETTTKRDIEITAEDREGWVSWTHATDGEGSPITTFQRLVSQYDLVYPPLISEIERLIVFLSLGHEQGAFLHLSYEPPTQQEEMREEDTASPTSMDDDDDAPAPAISTVLAMVPEGEEGDTSVVSSL